MRKRFPALSIVCFLLLSLCGCSAIGEKSGSLSVIYTLAALISAFLLIAYLLIPAKKSAWFILLFTSVLVVNLGYLALALSRNLNEALHAKLALRAEADALAHRLARLPRLDDCTVSHYCCELYPHICGTGTGYTASGAPVQAGVSVAVDPTVIPLGSTVYVDYGDGAVHTYLAQDTGGAVSGSHIDVAVATHAEATRLGMKNATVWWEEK